MSHIIYKNDKKETANETKLEFLDNGDITIYGSDYGTSYEKAFGSDEEEMQFSISKDNQEKLMQKLKNDFPEIVDDKQDIVEALTSAFNKELAYRKIFDYLSDSDIELYGLHKRPM